MEKTPRSLRLHIGLFGRTNVGKSTFLNVLTSQEVAITSPVPGTTTDPVEKNMEFLPLGPVVFIDTAGLDDTTELAAQRLQRTYHVLQRVDAGILLVESNQWTKHEEEIWADLKRMRIPALIVVSKADLQPPNPEFLQKLQTLTPHVVISALEDPAREEMIQACKSALKAICPSDSLARPSLLDGVLSPGDLAILMVPIDSAAPQGRLILPQVQTIRAALDLHATSLVVSEQEYAMALKRLASPPELVICDSQVVAQMVRETPSVIPCTTFSILFARLKADLPAMVRAVCRIDDLQDGDRVLILEACSHHPTHEDIGRVKIPNALKAYTRKNLQIDILAGHDNPEEWSDYRLLIHCGACMLNRRAMCARLEAAANAGVPMTNYGLSLAFMSRVLRRVLSPFPDALKAMDESTP